jgi:N-acetylmuramoyl-L-alanine amidase
MAKIIKAFFLALFVTSFLFSKSPHLLIKEAQNLLKTGQKSDILKAYNNYKSAYLKALINDDKKLIQISIAGIKHTQSMLGIKSNIKTDKKPKLINSALPKSLNTIIDYKSNINQIIITFQSPIYKKNITSFKLQEDGLKKEIFDIYAYFDGKLTHIKSKFFKDIRIAQFNPTTTRIVLEKRKNFYVKTDIFGNKLILSAFSSKKEIPKKQLFITPKKREKNIIIKNIAKSKLIFIDAGHGGIDSGAVGYKNLQEKNIVLKVAKLTAKELRKRGYKVKMSRNKDIFIKLKKRTQMANKVDADLFISIHANSIPNKKNISGIETFFLSPARSERSKRVAAKENRVDLEVMNEMSQKTFLSFLNREKIVASNKLAIDLQKNILANIKSIYKDVKDSGVREGPFWVLVGAQMPAVLIEIGYITNPKEARRINSYRYQKLLAKGIADGVDRYFYHNM